MLMATLWVSLYFSFHTSFTGLNGRNVWQPRISDLTVTLSLSRTPQGYALQNVRDGQPLANLNVESQVTISFERSENRQTLSPYAIVGRKLRTIIELSAPTDCDPAWLENEVFSHLLADPALGHWRQFLEQRSLNAEIIDQAAIDSLYQFARERAFLIATVFAPIFTVAIAIVVATLSLIWFYFTRKRRRVRRGLCPECKYDMAGLPEPKCPECGNALSDRQLALRPQASEQPQT